MAITQTSDMESSKTLAYNQSMALALRPQLAFSTSMISTVEPTAQSHVGGSVQFGFVDDLAPNTTPLTEAVDVTPKKMSDDKVIVTLDEYGDSVGQTRKARGLAFVPYDSLAARVNSRHAADSFEELHRDALMVGTNVVYGGGKTARANLVATDVLDASIVRRQVAKMRGDSVEPVNGNNYLLFIDPDVSVDYREETGDATWTSSADFQNLTAIQNGYVGNSNGASFVETSRCQVVDDGGSGSVDAYLCLMTGREALAKTYSSSVSSPMPQVEISGVGDHLNRFEYIGWYWLGGLGIYRQAAVRRIEVGSSAGDNT